MVAKSLQTNLNRSRGLSFQKKGPEGACTLAELTCGFRMHESRSEVSTFMSLVGHKRSSMTCVFHQGHLC